MVARHRFVSPTTIAKILTTDITLDLAVRQRVSDDAIAIPHDWNALGAPCRRGSSPKVFRLDDPKICRGLLSASRATRESQCSRQQRLEPRTTFAETVTAAELSLWRRAAADLHRYARVSWLVIDGEDVVHDTLVRAFVALPGFEEAHHFTWLFRMS